MCVGARSGDTNSCTHHRFRAPQVRLLLSKQGRACRLAGGSRKTKDRSRKRGRWVAALGRERSAGELSPAFS
jgi:hypothetical protein